MQNEFTTEGGILHPQVKDVMVSTGMLDKSAQLCKAMRSLGVLVMHAPITFAPDASDNPNRHLGILGRCVMCERACGGVNPVANARQGGRRVGWCRT